MGEGQGRCPGRQRRDLSRSWQWLAQSVRGLLADTRKDGFGLNAAAGHGNSNRKYYGEYYIRTGIKLAPNAVVILNRLCYASGNSEWGSANPTKTVAKQRVDNFGAGFLRAGARAVFADGITDASYILYGLFKTNRSIGRDLHQLVELGRHVRLQVQLGADARLHRVDGAQGRRPLLPVGRRQPGAHGGDIPSQLTRIVRTDLTQGARRPRSGTSSWPGPSCAWGVPLPIGPGRQPTATLATMPSIARIVMRMTSRAGLAQS